MKREFTRLPDAEFARRLEGLHELLQEHQRTHRAFRESPNEYEELKLERQRAREEDGQAQVSAFRAGGKDPPTRKEDALV